MVSVAAMVAAEAAIGLERGACREEVEVGGGGAAAASFLAADRMMTMMK